MNLWNDMMSLPIPLAEKVIRPVLVYVFLIVALRLAGKRELAQMNTFDFIVLLLLSNTVQNAIIGDDTSLVGGIIGAMALMSVNIIVVRFMYGHPLLARLLEGSPDVLIVHGKIQQKNLEREGITVEELEAAAHRQGFTSLKEVERATLEAAGTIAFIGKKPGSEARHYRELIKRLDALSEEVHALREGLRP